MEDLGPLANLVLEVQLVTQESREKQVLVAFLDYQACLDPVDSLDQRETEEVKVIQGLQELEMRGRWDHRDLMACLDLLGWESLVPKDSEVLLANKVSY